MKGKMAAPRPLPIESFPSEIQELMRRDGTRCLWCGAQLGIRLDDWTRDHVIARSRGGKTVAQNLILSCRRCNSRRKSKSALAFLAEQKRRGHRPLEGLVLAAVARAHGDALVVGPREERTPHP
jgi:5-methylcytosine-specific restriction endonuclease McrA